MSFFLLTYFLNRPCVYCSALLLILFISSCYWSDQCFFDIHSNWFEPRRISSAIPNPLAQAEGASGDASFTGEEASFLVQTVNETAAALASAAMEEIKRRAQIKSEWTGVGMEWIRSWLGAREWRDRISYDNPFESLDIEWSNAKRLHLKKQTKHHE
ncbi:MAG: hypothetical protein Q9210_003170 [Variospora velana]